MEGQEPPRSGDDDQPQRTLQAFAKVALAPGAWSTVDVLLDRQAFATWDVVTHGWVVPPGAYAIAVGTSSRDLVGAGTVDVAPT